MKYLFLFILSLPVANVFSQDLSGVWTGWLFNDSTGLSLQYEVAICDAGEKSTAFSFTNFILNKREVQGVKSLKLVKDDRKIIFIDIELVYDNYPTRPPKGVRQVSEFNYLLKDGVPVLEGKFQTTRTRQAGRPVTGSIKLQKLANYNRSQILPVLKKQKLEKNLCFLSEEEIASIVPLPDPKQQDTANAKKPPAVAPSPVIVKAPEPPKQIVELAKRKVEALQTVFITADSVRFDVYDNGYVDGDSISIIVNGKVFMEHLRLTDRAISKVLHVGKETGDSIQVVLFAENLGSIAPNSGVLVITDGNKRTEVHFSGDLKNNKSVILRRRKN